MSAFKFFSTIQFRCYIFLPQPIGNVLTSINTAKTPPSVTLTERERDFSKSVSNYEILSHNYESLSYNYEILSHDYEMQNHNYEIVNYKYEIKNHNYEILSHTYEMLCHYKILSLRYDL